MKVRVKQTTFEAIVLTTVDGAVTTKEMRVTVTQPRFSEGSAKKYLKEHGLVGQVTKLERTYSTYEIPDEIFFGNAKLASTNESEDE